MTLSAASTTALSMSLGIPLNFSSYLLNTDQMENNIVGTSAR
jgi:hypothetical protein